MKITSRPHKKPNHLLLFTSVALLLSLFLLFIDEGNYSLSAFADMKNLVPLSLYFLAMLLGQAFSYVIFSRFFSEAFALRLSLFLGSLVGVVVMAVIFMYWMA